MTYNIRTVCVNRFRSITLVIGIAVATLCIVLGGAFQDAYADLLEKVRNNPAQRKQNARSRRVNVYGAYAVIDDSALWDKTVLLIDDVKTTGATLNECAKMLRMHGAKAVYAATVAIA